METFKDKFKRWIEKYIQLFKGKKFIFFILIIIFVLGIASYSRSERSVITKQRISAPGDTTKKNNPNVNIKVNRKYDDKGNLIQYDSIYSYKYVGKGFHKNSDSILKDFRPFFDKNYPEIKDKMFNEFFDSHQFNDSMFLGDDFFKNGLDGNWFQMDEAFRKMDSLQYNYFRQKSLHNNEKVY